MNHKPSHGAHACVRYFVLLQWDPDYGYNIPRNGDDPNDRPGRWTIEYGSYSRKDVKDERDYYHEGHESIPKKHMRIKEICSCEAGMEDLLRLANEEPRP